MQIIDKKLTDLKPYANNPRHNAKAVPAVKESILKFGFKVPIVIDKNNVIVCGHTRFYASKEIGLETVPCIVADDLTDEQINAFRLVDNRVSEFADWNFDKLAEELSDLQDFDFEPFGFDELMAGIGETFVNNNKLDVEEDDNFDSSKVPTDTIIKAGDVISLNNHKVICGSSKDEENFIKLFGEQRYHLVFTDPPYGVSIGEKNRMLNKVQESGRVLADIKDDNISVDDLYDLLVNVMKNAKKYSADDCTYFVCAPQGGELGMMMMMMQDAGLKVRHNLIWYKNQPTFSMGRLDYDYQHEPILLTWGKKHKRPMKGEHRTSVWKIDRERKCDLHPTMKPVALPVNAMLNNSDEGDLCADFFLGSGTTLIAAEKTNRICYGMEIEPHYCMVIANRYKQYCEENNISCKMFLNGNPYDGN